MLLAAEYLARLLDRINTAKYPN